MTERARTELTAGSQRSLTTNDPGSAFRPLALRSMFWRPAYLESSDWLEHIPFAFWLVEAQRPAIFVELDADNCSSFFAFCQAVDRLGVDTKCFGFDTWGMLDEPDRVSHRLFDRVKAYNDAQYSAFARLARGSSLEAADHFSDGTVDLLHFQRLHTLENVREAFDVWLPKLSARGALVLHGTNAGERGCGVHRFFDQLQADYPVFEFVQAQGLGIVGVGDHQAELLQRLFASNEHEPAKRVLHEVFARLGRACADSVAATERQARIGTLTDQVRRLTAQLDESHLALERAEVELARRTRGMADAPASEPPTTARRGQRGDEPARRPSTVRADDVSRLEEHLEGTSHFGATTASVSDGAAKGADARLAAAGAVDGAPASGPAANNAAADSAAPPVAGGPPQQHGSPQGEDAEARRMAAENAKLRRKNDILQRDIEERYRELAKLTQLLESSHETRVEPEQRPAEANGPPPPARSATSAAPAEPTQDDRRKPWWSPLRRLVRTARRPIPDKWVARLRALRRSGSSARSNEEHALQRDMQQLRQSGLFDADWYRTRNPDVASTKIDPVRHYLLFGASEGRDPGPQFSTRGYLAAYPDVAAAKMNPLLHYVSHGRAEGRKAPRAQ